MMVLSCNISDNSLMERVDNLGFVTAMRRTMNVFCFYRRQSFQLEGVFQIMGIIFIVLAVIYLVRRPKIKALENYQFPHIQPQEFERWKHYELLSIDIFLWVLLFSTVSTTAAMVIGLTLSQALGQSNSIFQIVPLVGNVLGIGVFIVGLVVSAVYGSKAASLKKRLGLELPK